VIEAAATYSFRIRFKRAPGFTLNANQQRQVLPDLQSGISLTLCAADLEKPIEQSEHLAFIGDGFNSVDEAQVAGTRFGEALLVTFASFRARIPVDFGWRGPVHPDAVVSEVCVTGGCLRIAMIEHVTDQMERSGVNRESGCSPGPRASTPA
jgi:hypothetical protein